LKKFSPYHIYDSYYSLIQSRNVAPFKFSNWEVSVFTVPFKWRFNQKEYEIKNRLTKSFNANFYVGRSWGSVGYTYRKLEEVGPFKRFWNAGVFVGFDVISVDSSDSKYLASKNYDKRDLGYFSTGGFIGYNFSDIKVGISIGVDLGVGKAARESAYNKSIWFGFGFGYKLSFLNK
jgi:hypothetical protein